MSDTKYNFDDYIFDNVLEDTYLAIKDVRENIDRWVKETREIDFDYNPYEGRDEREKLDKVITKNIVNSIKDRLYNVDFENKVMRGVNVEAVRSVVGRDDFSTFFRPSQILKYSIDTEEAIQLMSPMDGVRYCHMCGDIEVGHAIGYCGDPCVKLSECFAGCFEVGLLSGDDSGKLTAYLTEALSPIKSFRLSEKYTDSSLLFDNLDHGTMGAPHFSGYEISFDDRDYAFDRQAAKDMREFCDYESKESETTVSRKKLKVIEVSEYDKDLEY